MQGPISLRITSTSRKLTVCRVGEVEPSHLASEPKPPSFVEQEKTKNMTQLILTINDESMLSKIKAACKMLKGVIDVRTVKEKKMDITQTAGYKEAMEDVKEGRVYHAENVEDMFQQILGYVPR